MEITFRFASWKADDLQKQLEKASQPGDELFVRTKMNMWLDLKHLLCPSHQWVPVDEEEQDYEEKCLVCGMVNQGDTVSYLTELYTQGCHNCAWHEEQGGDWVPYGRSGAHLPIISVCTSPKFYDDDGNPLIDESLIEKQMNESMTCPHWEGTSKWRNQIIPTNPYTKF